MSLRSRPGRASLALVAAAAAAVSLPAFGEAPAATTAPAAQAPASPVGSIAAPAKPQAAPTLAEARAKAAAAQGGAGLAAALDGLSASLSPSDALTLLAEFLPKVQAPADRSALALRAGDLALLLGRFPDAAARYEEASAFAKGGRDGGFLLRAARARLAAGESDRATDLASLVLMTSPSDAGLCVAARLVGAWALAEQGRPTEAASLAAEIAGSATAPSPASAELRREARFLCWAVADSAGKAAVASLLAAEFPGSPEALMAAGTMATAPVPHWYLGALAFGGIVSSEGDAVAPAPPPAAAAPASVAAPPTAPAGVQDGPSRFQVGYYAKLENAKAMADKLLASGFAASLEARPQLRAKPGDDGKRWAVVVDGGKEPAKTQARLKDAGYESYPLF